MVFPILSGIADYQQLADNCESMRVGLIALLCVFGLSVVLSIVFTALDLHRSGRARTASVISYILLVMLVIACVFCYLRYSDTQSQLENATAPATAPTEMPTEATDAPTEPSTEAPTIETTETTEPPTEPAPELNPQMDQTADPSNWGVKWEIMADGQIFDSIQRDDPISFCASETYYPLPGVPSFRGDNYRTGASYGNVTIERETLTTIWNHEVGSLDGWPGVGWTGQPLCVQWDHDVKQIMNLYDSKKAKDNLIEVICTTLDGHIYFYDMEDGTPTRDPLWIGMSFKGTASLDPRGYPILYAGSGLVYGKNPRMYAISLIDTTILWEQDGGDSFSNRSWYAFDSSPMISADTDTIIWPGESGILYTIKLNTQYDPVNGTVSQSPETVAKARYTTSIGRTVGFESSCVIVDNYVFIGDNGGMFFCVDLNTMQLIWAQDIGDDLNATPVFEWGNDGQGYLYLATSMEYGNGTSNVFKISANTGAVIWKKSYSGIIYDKDVSGGTLSSPVLGKAGTDLEGVLIGTVAKTPGYNSGYLFALDTETGEVIWEEVMSNYTWSSPVALYTEDNKGYIAVADSGGQLHLVEGATGEFLYSHSVGTNVEASPVVFGNYLVIGTRGSGIYGIQIK